MRTQVFQRLGRLAARQAIVALWVAVVGVVSLGDSVFSQAAESRGAVATPWVPERLPDGQPKVQGGLWRTPGASTWSLTNPALSAGVGGSETTRKLPSLIVVPPNGEIPYQPWAAARKKQQESDIGNPTRPEHIDPQARCLSSVPRLYNYVSNYTILQPPGMVVFLWEIYHQYRVIRVDGSPHIGPNIKLWWGDGVGRWEGNTLVVDTTNLNAKIRLTHPGDFFSSNARLSERMTFVGADTMIYEVTIDDPTVFTQPWTYRIPQKRLNKQELIEARGQSDFEIWEEGCVEGSIHRPSITPAYSGESANPK